MKRVTFYSFAVLIIALILAMAGPSFVRVHEVPFEHTLANNLRIVEAAKAQWVPENVMAMDAKVTIEELTTYFKNFTPPPPIIGETYGVSIVREPATVTLPENKKVKGLEGTLTLNDFQSQ